LGIQTLFSPFWQIVRGLAYQAISRAETADHCRVYLSATVGSGGLLWLSRVAFRSTEAQWLTEQYRSQ
jgi:hypothetical protein